MLGIPGIWWIDLQIDGVRKGYACSKRPLIETLLNVRARSLAKHHNARLPQPGSIIASSHTSPIDSLYLAAIFDPVFTASYPSTRLVQRIPLFKAILRAFQYPQSEPPAGTDLINLKALASQYPHQAIVVFPESTTTNGKGVLPFNTSLLSADSNTRIFPISLRYTAADITTPLPGTYVGFLWNLLSKPTHCIRVRIAENVNVNSESSTIPTSSVSSGLAYDDTVSSSDTLLESEDTDSANSAERRALDKVAEALARLGRAKRVGLGVKDKDDFIKSFRTAKGR